MGDTRVESRYALEIDAEIRCGDELVPARTRNFSRGGLAVIAPRALPVGAAVILSISLVFEERAMSEPLELGGRIVWCTPLDDGGYQLGATFVGMTRDQRLLVEMFLRYLTTP